MNHRFKLMFVEQLKFEKEGGLYEATEAGAVGAWWLYEETHRHADFEEMRVWEQALINLAERQKDLN